MKVQESPASSSSASRSVLILAVAAAILSLIALFITLVLYAMSVTPWPGLIAIGLYGLPIALIFLLASVLCTGSWLVFGAALKKILSQPGPRRIFNQVMAALLVLSLLPTLQELATGWI